MSKRLAHNSATPNNQCPLTLDGDVVVVENCHAAGRGSRYIAVESQHKPSCVDRVNAVNVLGRINRSHDGLKVDLWRQWLLDYYGCDLGQYVQA